MKIENYVEELKNCIAREDVEKFLVEYEPKRTPNANINGKMINMREFLTFILNNCEKVCASQIREKIYKEWNNPGNLARKFLENIFQEEFSLDNKNKSSYQMPQINYINSTNGMALYEAMEKNFDEFRKSLTEEDYFNKDFWKEALKQKHFMPLFAEFLFDQEDYENLKQFLKDNFYEEIEKKVKEEIDKDLKNLASENPEINKTSLIYTRYYTFFDFFEGSEKEIMDNLGLSKFYNDGIFDSLLEKELDEVNLYLLAALVDYNFNGAFFTGDCKRVIGSLLNLSDFYEDEEKSIQIFSDNILYKIVQNINEFYFVLENTDWCWVVERYIKNSKKLKEFFEDFENKSETVRVYYDWRSKIPWDIIESCEELEEIFDEDELQSAAEEEGYESFKEMCEEMEYE